MIPSRPLALTQLASPRRTSLQWLAVLRAAGCGVRVATAWAPVLAEKIDENTFSMDDDDLGDFLPNILHESQKLSRMEENLDYSVAGLLATFEPHRITPAQARTVGRAPGRPANQRAIANFVYGGAWGFAKLGNKAPDDGWRYRGRSPIQITGLYNYRRVGQQLGVDLVAYPERLAEPAVALDASIAWWEDRIPDALLGETTAVRERVNGGRKGLDEVMALTRVVHQAMATA